jgi:hypothetical protein
VGIFAGHQQARRFNISPLGLRGEGGCFQAFEVLIDESPHKFVADQKSKDCFMEIYNMGYNSHLIR